METPIPNSDPNPNTDSTGSNVEFSQLLDLATNSGTSDIHIAEGSPIMFRISGRLTKVEGIDHLSKEQMEHILYPMVPEKERDLIYKQKDLDISYEHVNGNIFRINIFFKHGRLAAVLRLIPNVVRSFESLNLPSVTRRFLKQKQGLIMITGPTGSGKSTTLAAMVDWVNNNCNYHIITIEDPIEFIYHPNKSVFSQRELHADTNTMANALKSVLRQDPDVVVIAEMRDPETISTAINICETGHLVFGTLHTSGAAQTISRIASAFPPTQQNQILSRLSDSLVGVISQRLVVKIGGGRIPLFEAFYNTPGIAHLIRSNDTAQLKNAIATGGKMGMVTMEKYAEDLIAKGVLDKADLDWLFTEEDHGDEK